MPSSTLVQRYNFSVAGEPVAFANPFAVAALVLEEPPAHYTVVIPASSTATLWGGVPLTTTFDVLAIVSDQSVDVRFAVNSGASAFTLFVRAGGYPVILQGDDSYVSGDMGGVLGAITMITAKNRNTELPANVQVLIGKLAT